MNKIWNEITKPGYETWLLLSIVIVTRMFWLTVLILLFYLYIKHILNHRWQSKERYGTVKIKIRYTDVEVFGKYILVFFCNLNRMIIERLFLVLKDRIIKYLTFLLWNSKIGQAVEKLQTVEESKDRNRFAHTLRIYVHIVSILLYIHLQSSIIRPSQTVNQYIESRFPLCNHTSRSRVLAPGGPKTCSMSKIYYNIVFLRSSTRFIFLFIFFSF